MLQAFTGNMDGTYQTMINCKGVKDTLRTARIAVVLCTGTESGNALIAAKPSILMKMTTMESSKDNRSILLKIIL